MSNPTAEQYEQLRSLATRLLMPGFPEAFGNATPDPLVIGAIPTDLVQYIPVAPETTILGSINRTFPQPALTGMHAQRHVEIVFDDTRTPEAIAAFYQAALPPLGWSLDQRSSFARQNGFQTAREGNRPIIFMRHPLVGTMNVHTQRISGSTQGRISISPDAIGRHNHLMERLPALYPPVNSQLFPEGMSGGDYQAQSMAVMRSEVPLAEIARHFNEQLQAAGWAVQAEQAEQHTAWSAWQFSDDQHQIWQGLLLIFFVPTSPHRLLLMLRADRSAEMPDASGRITIVGNSSHITFHSTPPEA